MTASWRWPELTPDQLAAAVGGRLIAPSLADSPGGPRTAGAATVRGITHDSRAVQSGMAFCCVVGQRHDGHDYARAAVAAGAVALLVEQPLEVPVHQIAVPSVRRALGPASAAACGHPWRRCKLVGVTGTAGKTTVAHALGSIAAACGSASEVIGTLDGGRTTPEAPDLYRRIAQAAHNGCDIVIAEVSSHALAQGRVDGARFAAAVFTNLSHEHLDFHGGMEEYFEAKARLFDGRSDAAVINTADPWGAKLASLAARTAASVIEWSPDDIGKIEIDPSGFRGVWRGRSISCGLLGRLNIANVAAAGAAAGALGFGDDAIACAMGAISPVPGRLWRVSGPDDDITVLVDFAHTPAALAAALQSARELSQRRSRQQPSRLWAVFGAGGDRDSAKRAPMGAAADRHADAVVLTADNPRSEDPAEIAAQIAAGASAGRRGGQSWHVELDRARAISFAVGSAQPSDVVLIAGKGHETTQLCAGGAQPFDDTAAALGELRKRRSRTR